MQQTVRVYNTSSGVFEGIALLHPKGYVMLDPSRSYPEAGEFLSNEEYYHVNSFLARLRDVKLSEWWDSESKNQERYEYLRRFRDCLITVFKHSSDTYYCEELSEYFGSEELDILVEVY